MLRAFFIPAFFTCLLNVPPTLAQLPPVLSALEKNDRAWLAQLLRDGASPNTVDRDSDNALMYAALYADSFCMQLLLDRKVDVNLRNKAGETALIWCIEDPVKTKLLLDNGADPNARTRSGNTPLLVAVVGHPNYPCVRLLIDHGADPLARNNLQETTLIRAACFCDAPVIELLLEKGVPIDAMDKYGNSALMNAVLNSNRPVTMQLLAKSPELPGPPGELLSVAVTLDDTDIAMSILQRTKNVNSTDGGGYSPLMWAVFNENADPRIIKALVDAGAKTDIVVKDGTTPLSWALKKGNGPIVEILKRAGAKK